MNEHGGYPSGRDVVNPADITQPPPGPPSRTRPSQVDAVTRRILAIDPGNHNSAYALIDSSNLRPVHARKVPNDDLLRWLRHPGLEPVDVVAIEMVASYGMAVGADVFETCVWIGRYVERSPVTPELVYRRDIKLHHCQSARAKDGNITQALIDRFAPGQPNRGKGTKYLPGWFYGFHADVWQAYACAVYVADVKAGRT